jgi:hypothetical protein
VDILAFNRELLAQLDKVRIGHGKRVAAGIQVPQQRGTSNAMSGHHET